VLPSATLQEARQRFGLPRVQSLRRGADGPRVLPHAARLATLVTVARLQPLAAWIAVQDMPGSTAATPALRG
jgi:hypothetical protein